MMMNLTFVKGEPVVLRDIHTQIFIGEVKAINEKLGRIVLKNLVQLPDRKPIVGYRNFDENEIVEIRSAEFDEINGDAVESSEGDSHIQTTPTEEAKLEKTEFSFIEDLGSKFQSAVLTLKKCSKIGLIALDVSKGRQKRASIVAASTATDVFIFDLLRVGDDLFVKGLGEILESREIEKIVHDSRLLSDCLKHKHAVSLENVRDVEAEDIMVVYQDRHTVRRHRRTLEYLVNVYLGISGEGLDFGTEWSDRPLNNDLLQELARYVSYLIPLQEMIQQKYLQRLIDASRVYNTHLRDLDLFDYLHYEHEKTLRKEMIKLVAAKGDIRGDGRPKVTT